MEKRGWPWKKKVSEKIASALLTDSSGAYELKQNNEQLAKSFDTMTPLQQAEARLKMMNDQLVAKEELVEQHAKVAEEAVTGWEKAETEAASLKQQLDTEVQKRLATEDRVSHLDGALKECMRQLRHVREEQEQKIHEIVLRKTREWDSVREELETKLGRLRKELKEESMEKAELSKQLQERDRMLKEAGEVKARLDGELRAMKGRLESAEKEQSRWKYEVHVLSKELEIRNEELEFTKKASEVASKQHLENVKKVAKLEGECQRLRLLVRKKLPGPAAIAQMRMEVEALGSLPEQTRRPSPSRRSHSPVPKHQFPPLDSPSTDQHVLSLEEEARSLRECLQKRDNELHSARLMCARTANKLSALEEQLARNAQPATRGSSPLLDGLVVAPAQVVECSREPSVASLSEDGNVGAEDESTCAESWASALMSELAHFRKGKTGSAMVDPLMDDFAEMEKLASMPVVDGHAKNCGDESVTKEEVLLARNDENRPTSLILLPDSQQASVASPPLMQEVEFKSVNQQCNELRVRLSRAENELNAIKLEKLAANAALSGIEKHLLTVLQTQTDVRNLNDVLEEVRIASNELKDVKTKHLSDTVAASCRSCHESESPEVRDMRGWSPSGHSSCQSEESMFRQDLATPTEKFNSVSSELATAVHRVVCLVEGLSQLDCTGGHPESLSGTDNSDSLGMIDTLKQWRDLEFDSCIESLVMLCNSLLQGKVDINDFLAEVASALEWLVNHVYSSQNKGSEPNPAQRQLELAKGSTVGIESHIVGTHRPTRKLILNRDEIAESASCSFGEPAKTSGERKELHRVLSEKNALARDLEIRSKEVHDIEGQFTQMKSQKEEADAKLKLLTQELELLKSQQQDSKINMMELQSNLARALDSKQSLLHDVADLVSSKKSLDSQLIDAKDEIKKLEEKIQTLEVKLQDEKQHREDTIAMFQELQQQHLCPSGVRRQTIMKQNGPNIKEMPADEPATLQKKDQEIAAAAEKLAECQQSILVLGEQLKALGLPKEDGASSGLPESTHHSTRSPISHRMHSLSDTLQGVSENNGSFYLRLVDNSITSPIEFHRQTGEGQKRLEHVSSMTDFGRRTLRGQNCGTHGQIAYGQQLPLDMYRTSGMTSPDYLQAPSPAATSSRDLALPSPARSPARFLKGRNWDSKSDSSSDKHATGFSRFFSKNRNAH